jgi:small subunit ribosomal protein S13
MARIAGVNLPNEKQLWIALTYIYGIGRSLSKGILDEAKVDPLMKAKELTVDQENAIRKVLEGLMVEGDLRRKLQLDVKRLQEIGSYRGYRHRRRLPARGQRTKTNARTRRGKKRTVANKKIEAK